MTEVVVQFESASQARARRRRANGSAPKTYPARIARQLALAHMFARRLAAGEFANQAALARALGFSRERVSNLMDLLSLAPNIQEELLFLECLPGDQPATEADLHRAVLRSVDWSEQRLAWSGSKEQAKRSME